MNERSIQVRLYHKFFNSHSLLVPNYIPVEWFECDLMGVTKSGYMKEWEIKLTKGDFKADRKKAKERVRINFETKGYDRKTTYKYQALEEGSTSGPRQFWYVVPEGLIGTEDLPPFAGLILIDNLGRIREELPAPVLHKEKVGPKIVDHARSVMYYRFWNERIRFDRLLREYEEHTLYTGENDNRNENR